MIWPWVRGDTGDLFAWRASLPEGRSRLSVRVYSQPNDHYAVVETTDPGLRMTSHFKSLKEAKAWAEVTAIELALEVP